MLISKWCDDQLSDSLINHSVFSQKFSSLFTLTIHQLAMQNVESFNKSALCSIVTQWLAKISNST